MKLRSFHLKVKIAGFIIGLFFLCLQSFHAWAGASHTAGDLYYLAQKSYYQLKAAPEKKKFRHNWERVILEFSKVVKRFPKSQHAYKAVFTMARLYEGLNSISKNSKDLDKALLYYKKVSADFNPGILTDDALFDSAEIYKRKKKNSAAARIFKIIIDKYPNGDQAGKARANYIKLADISARHKNNLKKEPASFQKRSKVQRKIRQKKIVAINKLKSKKTKETGKEKVASSMVAMVTEQDRKEIEKKIKKKTTATKVEIDSKRSAVKKPLFKQKLGGHLYVHSSLKSVANRPLIVVDAGHGGKDKGATSAKGAHEKDVNLTIARHIKTILVNRFKYRVVMTRKDDIFIPLKERSAIANSRNAELFVSIHANAAKRKSAHGIETYYLGRANNDRALETASRENGKLVYSVKDDQVQQILASLITNNKINDSSRLAGTVQEKLFRSTRKKFKDLKNLGVKEGPFYVLHGANMPSILVEVGFLTNRKEAKMLTKSDYLYSLASSIAEGIHKFMREKGPSI